MIIMLVIFSHSNWHLEAPLKNSSSPRMRQLLHPGHFWRTRQRRLRSVRSLKRRRREFEEKCRKFVWPIQNCIVIDSHSKKVHRLIQIGSFQDWLSQDAIGLSRSPGTQSTVVAESLVSCAGRCSSRCDDATWQKLKYPSPEILSLPALLNKWWHG